MSPDDDALARFLSMVKIGTEEECEEATCVVCVRKKGNQSPFTDDLTSTCAVCGEEIIHRPYTPQKPPKVCMECVGPFLEKLKAEEKSGE